ncbi:DNA polymerase [uncultured archaeon]|nr:DNA polymerase [uncultured archaeon]
MLKMIVAEKAIAGRSIAAILSGNNFSQYSLNGAQAFKFKSGDDDVVVFPLSGHISDVEFPSKYSPWVGTDLRKLTDAEVIYSATAKEIVAALRSTANGIGEVIVATDADREGESIGVEALNYIKETNPGVKIRRAYFSAISKKDLDDAFSKLQEVDYNFADSADSRREIDLIWGAVLTRFLSLVSGKLGQDYLSVGRVQTPSVDYAEEIVIKGPDGIVGLEKIGDFVGSNSLELERTIGPCEVFFVKKGFEALSFNPSTLKMEFKPITSTVRHKHMGSLIEVQLETGRRVRITHSHSVFVLRNSRIEILFGEELKEGDILLAPKVFNSAEIDSINILGELKKIQPRKKFFVYGAFSKKFVIFNDAGRKFLRSRRIEKGLIVYKTRFPSSTVSQWETGVKKKADYKKLSEYLGLLDYNVDFFLENGFGKLDEPSRKVIKVNEISGDCIILPDAFIGCSDKKWVLPIETEITNEMARLLGYYLAEGSKSESGCGLDFGSHEIDLANDAVRCIKKVFGKSPGIILKKSSAHINFGGALFSRVLDCVFKIGNNAREKAIPAFVFNFPREKKIEFLRGYFEGDGNFSTSGQLMCCTASEKLASNLVYLLSMLGVVATIERGINRSNLPRQEFSKERFFFKVKVSGKENLSTLKDVIPMRHLEKFEEYCSCPITRCGFDGLPIKEAGISEIWADLPRHHAQRIGIQKLTRLIESTNKNLSQSTIQKLRTFADSDLLFLKIKKIEQCKPTTDYVFDISVKDNENFVGGSGGIVLHNTLAIIVNREKERLAFKTKKYWELKAVFEKEKKKFEAEHRKGKFWEKSEAEKAALCRQAFGIVTDIKSQRRVLKRPTPFNTTDFLRQATSIGFSAGQAMDIAERLYQQGYTSYPRTDNTVYPKSLDLRATVQEVSRVQEFYKEASALLAKKSLVPSQGSKETKDHPPIYPVAAVERQKLSDRDWKIYELICRRFMATLADDAVTENLSVDISLGNEPFVAHGQKIIEAGWKDFYPYSEISEVILPQLSIGDKAALVSLDMLEKETQPPSRYSQSSLIKLMEDLGLGTKSTRHTIIQKLYARHYLSGSKAIEPNKIAFAVVDSLERHDVDAVKPDMTAELEKEMDLIAAGKKAKPEVVSDSRKFLHAILERLMQNKDQIGSELRAAFREDSIIGKCDKCDGMLRMLISRNKKHFLGCTNYPKCTNTYPLPQKGKISPLGKLCAECGRPVIRVSGGRRAFEMCVNMDCKTKDEWKAWSEKRAADAALKAAAAKDAPAKAKVSAPTGAASGPVAAAAKPKRAPRKKKAARNNFPC